MIVSKKQTKTRAQLLDHNPKCKTQGIPCALQEHGVCKLKQ